MTTRCAKFCVCSAMLALALCSYALAGSLAPPAGPVLPTMKDLQTVEPRVPVGPATTPGDAAAVYVIALPGSYYLTGNVGVPAGLVGIRIDADGVTLDLRGFEISTIAGGTDGILVNAFVARSIHVRDGSVRGFADDGIDALSAEGIIIENVSAKNNTNRGIRVGRNSVVRSCTAGGNGTGFFGNPGATFSACAARGNGDGFVGQIVAIGCSSHANTDGGFASGGIYQSCSALENGGIGFEFNSRASASGCVAAKNTGDGFRIVNDPSTLADCIAIENGGSGFRTNSISQSSATFINCLAELNASSGFSVSGPAVLNGCLAMANTSRGVSAGDGLTAIGCTVRDNMDAGINAGQFASITGCSVSGNAGTGIVVSDSGQIIECTVSINTLGGISVANGCLVRANNCDRNTDLAPGLYANGTDNRIEGNTIVTQAGTGLKVVGSGNLIIRNSVSASVQYDIAASNKVGTIVVAPNSVAILGNSGGAGVGTTDPWGNLSF